ncbi:hypothetical protein tinsulaeT_04710 [Thalassotalea insulae]|uniref:Esterase n=1 Tax=Thalassotalea insulae TaxID=2056778 RepID=A0ABQ6GR29_9GAMM|nr:alpha/beta hydrolase-fold protein [Thalassotalea insulae]GLX77131.1 hypothetical protein tinsulaeT_04710 [Thalassotalea insulae]
MQKINLNIVSLLITFVSLFSYANENKDIKEVIHSNTLNEDRTITVILPEPYNEDKETTYPVIYLLDGDQKLDFPAEVVKRLSTLNMIPNLIIVAIDNTNRRRDFVPSTDENNNGPHKFISFMEKELIPFIDNKYRTKNYKILAGHSLAGLLTLYTFQHKPELFQAHFAFSPSLGSDNDITKEKVINFLNKNKQHHNYLYVNLGREGLIAGDEGLFAMRKNFIDLSNVLSNSQVNALRFKTELLEDEHHFTTYLIGFHRALMDLYKNWFVPMEVSKEGVAAIKKRYQKLSSQLGYEVTPHEGWVFVSGLINDRMFNDKKQAYDIHKYNVQLHPTNIRALSTMASMYEEFNEVEPAIDLLNKAIALENKDSENYQRLNRKIEDLKAKL